MRNCIALALTLACVLIVLSLTVLCGCEAGNVLGRAIFDSAADSASELDSEYGETTFEHATRRRLRCSDCGGNGYVSQDEARPGNPVGECRVCQGKGWTYEF